MGEQTRQFDTTQAAYQPYQAAGTGALEGIGDLVGINGAPGQQEALDALQNSPMLQSLFRNGEEGLLQNASATGGLRGGNTQGALADFRADKFAEMIQQQLGNLSGIANMGLGATGSVSGFGAAKAGALGDLFTQQGQARAGGLLTRGGINAANWKNAGSFLDDAVSAAVGAGAGPGGAPFNFGNMLNGRGRLKSDIEGMIARNPGIL